MIPLLKMPSHPNILSPIGITTDRFQIVMEWTKDIQYGIVNLSYNLELYPEVNWIGLVSPLLFITFVQ